MSALLLALGLACGSGQDSAPAAEPQPVALPRDPAAEARRERFKPQQELLPWPPGEERSPAPAVQQAAALIEGDPAAAMARLDAHLAEHPDDPDALVLRSAQRPAEQLDQALAEAQRAVDLDGDFLGARIQLTDLLVPQRRCAEALPHLDWMVDRYPQHANAWSNRAFCSFATGHWEPGLADTLRACELGLVDACARLPGLRARHARRQALAGEDAGDQLGTETSATEPASPSEAPTPEPTARE